MTEIYGTNANDILPGDIGNDSIYGRGGNDILAGSIGNDSLYGDDGNDTLVGGDGDDILYGGNGDDILYGGNGNDSHGNDIFHGGSGSDIFRMEYDSSLGTSSLGRVLDFTPGEDKIKLGSMRFDDLSIVQNSGTFASLYSNNGYSLLGEIYLTTSHTLTSVDFTPGY
jgi:Ca2+-binding RTX toxin-like protein